MQNNTINYGQCIHGENMSTCYKCRNKGIVFHKVEPIQKKDFKIGGSELFTDIEIRNKLIAEFMGGVLHNNWGKEIYGIELQMFVFAIDNTPTKDSCCNWSPSNLQYHSSWDWLMNVVHRIETMENGSYGFTIDPWGIEIIEYFSGKEEVIVKYEQDDGQSKMEQYYQSVLDFIEWHNKKVNSKNNGRK